MKCRVAARLEGEGAIGELIMKTFKKGKPKTL
jgi:hypothetical protein